MEPSGDGYPDQDRMGVLGPDQYERYGDPQVGDRQVEGFDEFDELLTTVGESAVVKPGRSWLNRLLWVLSFVPLTALGLLLSMAVRVQLQDGAWPARNQPDPKDLGLHNTVTVVAILVSFIAVLAVPLIALAAHFLGRRRVPVVPPVLAVVSLAALLLVLVADIAGLGDWIGD